MQEHERRSDLRGVETCSGLFKLPGFLDVEHKIATVYELHHKEETVLQRRKGHFHMTTQKAIISQRARRYYTASEPITVDMLRWLRG